MSTMVVNSRVNTHFNISGNTAYVAREHPQPTKPKDIKWATGHFMNLIESGDLLCSRTNGTLTVENGVHGNDAIKLAVTIPSDSFGFNPSVGTVELAGAFFKCSDVSPYVTYLKTISASENMPYTYFEGCWNRHHEIVEAA